MTIAITRAAEGYSRRAFTVSDIFKMIEAGIINEDEKFELIEGEIIPMSPKGNQHEVLKAALTEIFAREKPDWLRLAIETSLYLSKRTFVEPDLCLYPKRLMPVDVKGRDVLLAIEVAGSSLGYDRGLKSRLYATHGVGELWVIDATRRVTWIHKGPNADGTWESVEESGADNALVPEALPQIRIVLAGLD
jgi:Uma2 family endonuclease